MKMSDFQIDVNQWERDMQYVQAMESTSQAGLNARSRRMPRRNMQFDTERVCFSSLFIIEKFCFTFEIYQVLLLMLFENLNIDEKSS